ncbi:MAG: MFS transporter [Deltaproteobacteria bacterium]
MARFRHIVRNRNFSLLWISQIISQFGDRLNQMALLALVYRFAPGSTTQIAKLMSFAIVPVFLVGPMAGVYVDRWDRRSTMVVADFVRAALVFSIAFYFMRKDILWPVYAIVCLAFCVSRFYVPAKMSIIPEIVKGDDLLLANSLVNTTGMVAAMMGFGLGGILVSWVGAKGGFVIDAVTFLIAGTLIFCVKNGGAPETVREGVSAVGKEILAVVRKSVLQEIKDAVVFLANQRQLRSCFGILFFLWAALGAVYVVSIVFIQQAFGHATREIGLLIVGLGVGLFIGSLVYGRLGHQKHSFKMIFACVFAGGVVLLTFVSAVARYPNLMLAIALTFILGLVVAPTMVISQTLVQELTESSMRGRLFSSLEIVVHLAFLLSMLIAAPLADRLGAAAVLRTVSFCLMAMGIGGFFLRYDQTRRA